MIHSNHWVDYIFRVIVQEWNNFLYIASGHYFLFIVSTKHNFVANNKIFSQRIKLQFFFCEMSNDLNDWFPSLIYPFMFYIWISVCLKGALQMCTFVCTRGSVLPSQSHLHSFFYKHHGNRIRAHYKAK